MKQPLLILLTIFFLINTAFGQGNRDSVIHKRPKIGLVLSGGGAKGLAHIGVLKVLDEVGIVPDYIAGTSMGSIVGGLYAEGYSAEEISQVNHRIYWSNYLTNNIPLYEIGMDQKHDYGRFIGEFPIKGKKVMLPSGLVESQSLWTLFHDLTWPVASVSNFDSLATPYRCCASDIIRGDIKTFRGGSLPNAMRSSMSIPAFFSPVIANDSTIYVDGGLGNNFPVNEIIDMGADIIIGVYVGLPEITELSKAKSVYTILMQTAMFSGIKTSKEMMDKCNILIIPDLKGYSTASFEHGVKIEDLGYEAALKYKDQLKHLADSINALGPPPAKKILDKDKKYYISKISVKGSKNVSSEFVIGKSELQPNTYVTKKDVENAVTNIYGTLYYDNVTYHLEKEANGYNLVFTPQEKENAILKAALQTNNYWGPSLILNYSNTNIITSKSRLTAAMEIAKLPRAKVNYLHYFGKTQRKSVDIDMYFIMNEIPVYNLTQKTAYLNDFTYGISSRLNYSLSNNLQISTGTSFGFTTLKTTKSFDVANPDTSFRVVHNGGFKIWEELQQNSLDRNFFPRRGGSLTINVTLTPKPFLEFNGWKNNSPMDTIYNPTKYAKLTLQYERYFSIGSRIVQMLGTNLGVTSNNSTPFDTYFIGASDHTVRYNDVAFYGLGYREKTIRNFGILKAETRIRLFSEVFLLGRINYLHGVDNDISSISNIKNPTYSIWGYAGGIGINTLFGPITLWGSGNDADHNFWWYVNAGFNF